jgi:hypothetical protein
MTTQEILDKANANAVYAPSFPHEPYCVGRTMANHVGLTCADLELYLNRWTSRNKFVARLIDISFERPLGQ